MEFSIEPYVGVGKILLGMTSQQIENILRIKPRKFKKFEDDEFETDAFDMCYVYYKDPGVCEAIEFFKPAIVTLNGTNLIGESYKDVKNLFLMLDEETEYEDTGLTSYKYGVGIYAPFAEDDPLEPVEGVIIFENGYYD
ncbi:hypothetical protein [Clostridium kluyveri]|uniref:Uncharacterized protein n=1 Tax=Clostridium kluyveri TaxID=1534 RepID=A0A1L5F7G8_CLOKL|nr:hypothetical protein [Clostridium kluyveri]APM38927.1 hypothetical protein BS101_09300 [Clostridium kluyveri]UZQ51247.1 hypothetical protein OP486_03470 [Clostridium kluyveri]